MAKTAKLKKSTNPAPNSRLARKTAAASSSLDLPASHSSTPPPASSFLAPQPNGGITKKKSQKPLKRKQRLRLEVGKQKAENVRGRTENKVLGSVGRSQKRKGRRGRWEEIDEAINKEVLKKKRKEGNAKGRRETEDLEGGEWIDEDEMEVTDFAGGEAGDAPGEEARSDRLPTQDKTQQGELDEEEIS